MAAPTTKQSGIDFTIKAGGTNIGGRRGATLNASMDSIETTSADSSHWMEILEGVREWSIDYDGLFLEGSSAFSGKGASVKVGGSAIKERTSATLGLTMDTIDATSADSDNWGEIIESTRSWTLDVETRYLDPAGNGAQLDALLTDLEDENTATIVVDLTGSSSLNGTARVADFSLETPPDDVAVVSLSLEGDGSLTNSVAADVDPTLNTFLTNFFSDPPGSFSTLFTTDVTGATEWNGTVYPTDITFEMPYDDPLVISGALTGDGTLTRSTGS